MKNIKIVKKAGLLALSALSIILSGCNGSPANTEGDSQKVYKIGVNQYAKHGSLDNCYTGFKLGLEEAGLVEGKDFEIDFQNAAADNANANSISQNFTAKKYDLIAAIATPSAVSAFSAAEGKDIPVVFIAVTDPIAAGIVKSIEKPENNVTGIIDELPIENQIKMIRAFMPEAKKIGILYTLSESNSVTNLAKFEAMAPDYGFEVVAIGVSGSSDIPLAIDSLLPQVDLINNFTDNNVVQNLGVLIDKADSAGIPVFGSEEEQVENGCVASEGIDYIELGKESGKMAAKILKGEAKASEIPVSAVDGSTSRAYVNTKKMEQFGLVLPEEYKDVNFIAE